MPVCVELIAIAVLWSFTLQNRWDMKRLLFSSIAVAACGMCLWPVVWFFAHLLPPSESMEVARRYAQAQGLPVQGGGGLQEYVTQPDAWGGCELKVTLGLPSKDDRKQVFIAHVQRSSLLTGWRVIEAETRDVPK